MPRADVVITGIGVVSPIGIGSQAVWESLASGRSGVRTITLEDPATVPVRIGGEVQGFDPKAHGVPRKSLKVMPRDAQLGVAASNLACAEAGIRPGSVDPERFGVVLGADRICSCVEHSEPPYRACMVDGRFEFARWGREGMADMFPLSFLRLLPNMIASHVSIVHDARGPNNTIHHAEVSSLLSIAEAARAIRRGAADVMLAGGASSQTNAYDWTRYFLYGRLSPRCDDPAAVMRPFDADRSGEVRGEGAAIFVLESRRHAEARGASPLAEVVSWSSAFAPASGRSLAGENVRRVVAQAVDGAGLKPADVGSVNAQGYSTREDDAVEAQALRDVLGGVPVTAPSSYFGNLSAAAGAMELAASVLGLARGLIPATLNYQRPDGDCPVRVVAGEAVESSSPTALSLNFTPFGQAAALMIARPEA